MTNLKSFLRRLQTLWRSEQLHNEIAEEMRFHIDQRAADNIQRGMPPAEARKEAERRFGGVARIQEQSYELRSAGWIESFVQDVVYGSRLLRRTPGFTLAADAGSGNRRQHRYVQHLVFHAASTSSIPATRRARQSGGKAHFSRKPWAGLCGEFL